MLRRQSLKNIFTFFIFEQTPRIAAFFIHTLRVHIPRILPRTTLTTRTCATKSISLTKEIYRSYQIFPSL